jgi:hypothetical protein
MTMSSISSCPPGRSRAGSLAAPGLAARIERRSANHAVTWSLCGAGMVVGWVFAPLHVAALCVAQLLSGLCMTSLEGLLDTTAARRNPAQVTGVLARATAARALGSAAGSAVLPLVVAGVGLPAGVGVVCGGLVVTALAVRLGPYFPRLVVPFRALYASGSVHGTRLHGGWAPLVVTQGDPLPGADRCQRSPAVLAALSVATTSPCPRDGQGSGRPT